MNSRKHKLLAEAESKRRVVKKLRKPGKYRRMRTLLREILDLHVFYYTDVNMVRTECRCCGATMLHYGGESDAKRHLKSCILSRIRRAL